MSRSQDFISMVSQYGARNYLPLPVVLSKGSGSKVYDVEGREYLDLLSSYSALNFGHAHPRLLKTLKTQAEKLAVCSRAFYSEELCLFSKELAEFTQMKDAQVLPMNSGAEAVETSLKLVRKWGYEKKKIEAGKAHIIAMGNNFHGRTISILSFSSEKLYRDGYGPFTEGFSMVPFGDAALCDREINRNTVAVMVEPIQAEAGILLPPDGYLKQLRDICDRKGILLILDEIQTGLGRTGKDFCFQYENIQPDVLILGKSLGGGLIPVSACIASRSVMEVIGPGEHGSTFGGNPLGSALAREALRVLREEKLSERAAKLGKTALETLRAARLPKVKEVRGKGLLIGIEMAAEAGGARRYCEALLKEGVLCKETHDNVIRVAPALTIPESDLTNGINKIISIIQAL